MRLELRSVDRERNRFRVYRMWLQPTLFGELDLVIEWGRIGTRLRRRSERFTAARWDELVTRRRRHGYGPCASPQPALSVVSCPVGTP